MSRFTSAGLAALAAAALAACSETPVTPESTLAAPDGATFASSAAGGAPDFVPGEVIVKFREGTSASGRATALSRANGRAAERIVTAMMRRGGDSEGLTIVQTPQGVA